MTDPVSRPRGRPRDPGKRDAILDAARRLMLAHGPDGIALDRIIGEAGISRSAFYSNFEDRDALIEALIERETDRLAPPELDELPFDGAAVAFGERLLRFLVDPDMIGFEKLIASAAERAPQLPSRFYDAGPGRSMRCLSKLIERGVAEGILAPLDADVAAEDLMALWQGMIRVEMTLGGAASPSDDRLRSRAERGVMLFARLYGASRDAKF